MEERKKKITDPIARAAQEHGFLHVCSVVYLLHYDFSSFLSIYFLVYFSVYPSASLFVYFPEYSPTYTCLTAALLTYFFLVCLLVHLLSN